MSTSGRTAPLIPLDTVLSDPATFRRLAGVPVSDLKTAIRLCSEEPSYRDDFLLALAWVHANELAVNVKGDRSAFNRNVALARVEIISQDKDFSALTERRPDRRSEDRSLEL